MILELFCGVIRFSGDLVLPHIKSRNHIARFDVIQMNTPWYNKIYCANFSEEHNTELHKQDKLIDSIQSREVVPWFLSLYHTFHQLNKQNLTDWLWLRKSTSFFPSLWELDENLWKKVEIIWHFPVPLEQCYLWRQPHEFRIESKTSVSAVVRHSKVLSTFGTMYLTKPFISYPLKMLFWYLHITAKSYASHSLQPSEIHFELKVLCQIS